MADYNSFFQVSTKSRRWKGYVDKGRSGSCSLLMATWMVLGFGEYIEEVYAAYEQHKIEMIVTLKGGKWSVRAEMSEEEVAAEQQRIFAEARAQMNGGATAPKLSEHDPSLS
ncbi:hypothetical protein ACFE04_022012 [Oxalis oulophora]